jgi:hypothetical protein
MIKLFVVILIGGSLVSFAPAPAAPPIVYRTWLAIPQVAPQPQACTWETAPARLRQQIEDPIGYPFGEVSAWSCAGDSQAVIAELAQRAAEMQAQAAAYRASHPIGGVR